MALYVAFEHYAVGSVFLVLRSKFVIGVRDKPMKMDKKVDGFSVALCP